MPQDRRTPSGSSPRDKTVRARSVASPMLENFPLSSSTLSLASLALRSIAKSKTLIGTLQHASRALTNGATNPSSAVLALKDLRTTAMSSGLLRTGRELTAKSSLLALMLQWGALGSSLVLISQMRNATSRARAFINVATCSRTATA